MVVIVDGMALRSKLRTGSSVLYSSDVDKILLMMYVSPVAVLISLMKSDHLMTGAPYMYGYE